MSQKGKLLFKYVYPRQIFISSEGFRISSLIFSKLYINNIENYQKMIGENLD